MDGWDSWKWSGEDKMLFVEMEISVTLRKSRLVFVVALDGLGLHDRPVQSLPEGTSVFLDVLQEVVQKPDLSRRQVRTPVEVQDLDPLAPHDLPGFFRDECLVLNDVPTFGQNPSVGFLRSVIREAGRLAVVVALLVLGLILRSNTADTPRLDPRPWTLDDGQLRGRKLLEVHSGQRRLRPQARCFSRPRLAHLGRRHSGRRTSAGPRISARPFHGGESRRCLSSSLRVVVAGTVRRGKDALGLGLTNRLGRFFLVVGVLVQIDDLPGTRLESFLLDLVVVVLIRRIVMLFRGRRRNQDLDVLKDGPLGRNPVLLGHSVQQNFRFQEVGVRDELGPRRVVQHVPVHHADQHDAEVFQREEVVEGAILAQ
jgi:hypothetical protein